MSKLMAQNGEQHDFPEEVVYDSQEEEDQWPESQSSVQNAAPVTETPKRPPLLKIYGRAIKRLTKSLSSTDGGTSKYPPSQPNPQAEHNLGSIPANANEGRGQLSPVSTLYATSVDHLQTSQNTRKGEIYDLESSDDDMPLQPKLPRNEPPLSLPPISSATATDDIRELANHPPEHLGAPEAPRRALRARRPEQQMPYTLDLIRHRDQFRRRGLKPVHNPGEALRSKENDDQYQADEDECDNAPEPESLSARGGDEHLSKRQRIRQANDDDEDQLEIHLRPGRRKFLDPRQFDVSRKVEPSREDTPEHEVLFTCYHVLTRRCLTLIFCPMMTSAFSPFLHHITSPTLLVQKNRLTGGHPLQLVTQRMSLLERGETMSLLPVLTIQQLTVHIFLSTFPALAKVQNQKRPLHLIIDNDEDIGLERRPSHLHHQTQMPLSI